MEIYLTAGSVFVSDLKSCDFSTLPTCFRTGNFNMRLNLGLFVLFVSGFAMPDFGTKRTVQIFSLCYGVESLRMILTERIVLGDGAPGKIILYGDLERECDLLCFRVSSIGDLFRICVFFFEIPNTFVPSYATLGQCSLSSRLI